MPISYRSKPPRSQSVLISGGMAYSGSGEPLLCADDCYVYRGALTLGTPVATFEDGRVYSGAIAFGAPLSTIVGNRIYDGDAVGGRLVAWMEGGDECDAAVAAVYHLIVAPSSRRTARA